MKLILSAIFATLLALPAGAQIYNPSVIPVPATPTSCSTLPLKVVSGTASVYGTNGSGGCSQVGGGAAPILILSNHVSIPNTGNTTNNLVATITIPANTLPANGHISIEANSGGQAGNTGTCNSRAAWSNSSVSGSGTTFWGNIAQGAGINGIYEATINARNSTASQLMYGYVIQSNGINTGSSPQATADYDTTAPTYILLYSQNSVSTDTCNIFSYTVTVWPK